MNYKSGIYKGKQRVSLTMRLNRSELIIMCSSLFWFSRFYGAESAEKRLFVKLSKSFTNLTTEIYD